MSQQHAELSAEAVDSRLLYFFNKFWDICGYFDLNLTTYIERSPSEYFAGFCSMHGFAPNWSWYWQSQQTESQYLESSSGNEIYYWLHISFIFRASSFCDS
ncbi:uncharacterized protein LOC108602943 [Drosophila busckii]|uniref:uncharacterized protein LOC108602943 n=1 Tax=Drosophila busckii TaxID=30019 RepID=UPI00083EB391|nr:uncharacterized protein LOC108602943 [Drosophila busckii]